ncbi:MAG: hypothetical protein SGJ04_04890 [Bacteroidota bacterium]|nr:hypothetical protein [Bacteroidota bacterium]
MELYSVKIKFVKSKLTINEYKKIDNVEPTATYVNQPWFDADNKKLYYSASSGKRIDIHVYDINNSIITPFIVSEFDKFSPMKRPDGKYLSCVVVESDSAQRIWLYDNNGKFVKKLSERHDSIGYYVWLTNGIMGTVNVPVPLSAHWLYIPTDSMFKKCSYSGRNLQRRPVKTPTLTFIDRTHKSDDSDVIFITDIKGHLEKIIRVVPGAEDYVWYDANTLIMTANNKLWGYNLKNPKLGWYLIWDIVITNGTVYRFAISPDKKHIALVSH